VVIGRFGGVDERDTARPRYSSRYEGIAVHGIG
jgi:hypothetical protein